MCIEWFTSLVDNSRGVGDKKPQSGRILQTFSLPIERSGGVRQTTSHKAAKSDDKRFDRARCACQGCGLKAC